MGTPDDLDEVLYKRLFDYKSAVANAALRFEDQTTSEVRTTLYRADGQLRYWVFVYIAAIDLFIPDPLDFERPSSCQAEILRHCEQCEQSYLLDLFPKARDSAWRLIVLMAERNLIGEPNPQQLPIKRKYRELELGLVAHNITSDNSINIVKDILNEPIGFGQKDLEERLERLTKLMKLKRMSAKRDDFLQCAILSLWVHPDFPLWLMEVEPARRVVGMLRECWGVGKTVERKAFEQAKWRFAKNDHLVTNRNRFGVITDVIVQKGDPLTVESYEFAKKYSGCIPKLEPKRLYGAADRLNLRDG